MRGSFVHVDSGTENILSHELNFSRDSVDDGKQWKSRLGENKRLCRMARRETVLLKNKSSLALPRLFFLRLNEFLKSMTSKKKEQ